ncbi:MAG: D-glycero-beta-D-manno-heptose-7-phosphate kinase [Alphaproteobacteria bacterium]|nr:D-glycero-beta-D-manno-heptose-7-phosphate kinase [Alphaproteobacteria bacterium]
MSDDSDLAAQVDQLAGARVLCIGDVMLDRFVYGRVERISPEAPIPILAVERQSVLLGGAGNVVRNLGALGAETCFITVVGDDVEGRELTRLVGAEKRLEPHLLIEPNRRTTLKLRYVAGAQQLLRADSETVQPIAAKQAAELKRRALEDLESSQVLVLSDYAKGVLVPALTQELIAAARARGRAVVVDPKGNDFRHYAGASVLKPNRRELAEATRMPVSSEAEVVTAARKLIADCRVDAVLVSLSQDGMVLVEREGVVDTMKAEAREVFDVSGAGDTVVATLGAALAAGVPLHAAARLANVAAGIVVGKIGTAVASAAELRAALHRHDLLTGEVKTVTLDNAVEQVAAWRAKNLTVGFANGCFDLLHPGHVALLARAKSQCDRLIVGLNGDASVTRLKGAGRPVQSEAARAAILASLASVDLVVIFNDDVPMKLIERLKPEVVVKGADWAGKTAPDFELVRSYGGRMVFADLTPGQSTTATIAKLAR